MLTTSQAAKKIGKSTATIVTLVRQEKITSHNLGSVIAIEPEAIKAFEKGEEYQNKKQFVSLTQACDLLENQHTGTPGITRQRAHQLIKLGTLQAIKIGKSWIVEEKEIARFNSLHRPEGRPIS